MAAYAPQSSDPTMAQINITPLVDVMLVLLVIFMLAAPAVTAPLTLNLPARTETDAKPPPRIELEITQAGEYVVAGRQTAAHELPDALAVIAARRNGTVVEINASPEGDYQSFATALSAARRSGLQHVSLQP